MLTQLRGWMFSSESAPGARLNTCGLFTWSQGWRLTGAWGKNATKNTFKIERQKMLVIKVKSVNGSIRSAQVASDLFFCSVQYYNQSHYFWLAYECKKKKKSVDSYCDCKGSYLRVLASVPSLTVILVKVGLKNTSVCRAFDYLMGQI